MYNTFLTVGSDEICTKQVGTGEDGGVGKE